MPRRFSYQKIKALREAHGLNTKDFADKIGVSRQMVNYWEAGDCAPTVAKIQAMMDAFGITEGYFFVDNDA